MSIEASLVNIDFNFDAPIMMGRSAFKMYLKQLIESLGLEYTWRNIRLVYTLLIKE